MLQQRSKQARERQQLALLYNIIVVVLATLKIAIVRSIVHYAAAKGEKVRQKQKWWNFLPFRALWHLWQASFCAWLLGCVLLQLQIMFTRLCMATEQLRLTAFGLLVLLAVDCGCSHFVVISCRWLWFCGDNFVHALMQVYLISALLPQIISILHAHHCMNRHNAMLHAAVLCHFTTLQSHCSHMPLLSTTNDYFDDL